MSKGFHQRVQTLIDRNFSTPTDQEGPYVVVLSSFDRLNDDRVVIRQFAGRTDFVDGSYHDDNAGLGDTIRDTRRAQFQINWASVLPKKHQRFRVSSYFTMDEVVKPAVDTPPNDNRGTGVMVGGVETFNTSNGGLYDNVFGKFIRIYTNLYSTNQFDASQQGRSGLLSIATRYSTQDIDNNTFTQLYQFESMNTYLHQPIIEYPAQDLLEIRLNGYYDGLILPEAVMAYDYKVETTVAGQDGDGNDIYNREVTALPVLGDWFLILAFTPCV